MIARTPLFMAMKVIAETAGKIIFDSNSTKNVEAEMAEPLYVEYDLPRQTKLNSNQDLCGYISPDGKYHKCGHCEHESFIVEFVITNFEKELSATEPSFFWKMPQGMHKEEYFLMKKKRYVKISSFEESINEMYLLFYQELTPQQTEIVFPK